MVGSTPSGRQLKFEKNTTQSNEEITNHRSLRQQDKLRCRSDASLPPWEVVDSTVQSYAALGEAMRRGDARKSAEGARSPCFQGTVVVQLSSISPRVVTRTVRTTSPEPSFPDCRAKATRSGRSFPCR